MYTLRYMFNPKPTEYANRLYNLLKKYKFRVIKEDSDGHKHVDLSIESARLDIEVDGIYHLTNPKQIIKDFKRSNYSHEDGYETLHVHNIDLEKAGPAIASAIAEVAKERENDIDIMAHIEEQYPETKIN